MCLWTEGCLNSISLNGCSWALLREDTFAENITFLVHSKYDRGHSAVHIGLRHLKLIVAHESGASGNPRGVISDKAFQTDVSTQRCNSILHHKQSP